MKNQQTKTEKVYIYGRHALYEALRDKPETITELFITDPAAEAKLVSLAEKNNVPVKKLGDKELRTIGRGAVHQGVVGIFDEQALLMDLKQFLSELDMSTNPAVAICGEVQDPHNLGAIIRSAAALGISGVIIPEHRQSPVTGTVVKTSVGMVFRLPIVSVGNVNQTLRALKDHGFWIYGLDMEGESLTETKFDRPSVFVIGNEGGGIREKTLELCDHKLSIPMHPRAESLNASVSAAVTFYEWSRQNPGM